MSKIKEELLKTDKHDVTVRFLRGNIKDNIKPILKGELDDIFLYVRTNNATHLTASNILDKLLRLKLTILDVCKSHKVIISELTLRRDNRKAALTNHHLSKLLQELNIDIVKNRSNGAKHLGGKGLCLKPHRTARLALILKATKTKL